MSREPTSPPKELFELAAKEGKKWADSEGRLAPACRWTAGGWQWLPPTSSPTLVGQASNAAQHRPGRLSAHPSLGPNRRRH
jgi:hypothetical protein